MFVTTMFLLNCLLHSHYATYQRQRSGQLAEPQYARIQRETHTQKKSGTNFRKIYITCLQL